MTISSCVYYRSLFSRAPCVYTPSLWQRPASIPCQ